MPNHDAIPDGSAVGQDPGHAVGPASGRGRVASSFGSAPDAAPARIDLNEALIRHRQATFTWRVSGVAMRDAGIDDGDVLLVDRAIRASHGHVIVAVVNAEHTLRRLWRKGSEVRLQAANPEFGDIVLAEGTELEVWGVVTTVIKSLPV
jgi:DNA polymerase V